MAGGLWRHADFLRLWAGETASQFGGAIGLIAIPYLAVTTLHASSVQMGVLTALETAGFLLVGLPAGALIDRYVKRRIMIGADLGRAALLLGLAVAYWVGVLSLAQVFVTVALIGVLTVFFDVCYQSYLPLLVADQQVVEGNAKLQASESVSLTAGPAVGGFLLNRLGSAVVVTINAVGYLASAVWLSRITLAETIPPRTGRRLVAEIGDGLKFIVTHRLLRRLIACTGLSNLASNGVFALIVLYQVRNLHFSAFTIGLVSSVAAIGGLAGSFVAGPLSRWLGEGATIIVTAAACAIAALAYPLASIWPAIPSFIVGGFLLSLAVVAYNISTVSFRQRLCPPELLGRMNASARFLVWGTSPVGALIGGLLSRPLGVLGTIWVMTAAGFLCLLPVATPSLWRLRSLPSAATGAEFEKPPSATSEGGPDEADVLVDGRINPAELVPGPEPSVVTSPADRLGQDGRHDAGR